MNTLDISTLPTIRQGHFANLKIETPQVRVWLSRMTLADGEVEPIQVEKLVGGVWVDFHGDVILRTEFATWCVQWVNRASVGRVANVHRREYDQTAYAWSR